MAASGRCVARIRWIPKARPCRAMVDSLVSICASIFFRSASAPVLSRTSATSSHAKMSRCKFSPVALLYVSILEHPTVRNISLRRSNSATRPVSRSNKSISSKHIRQSLCQRGGKSTPPLKSAIKTLAPFFMACTSSSFSRTLLPLPVEPPNRM